MNLELNCSHPAIDSIPRGPEFSKASEAITLFKEGRETFIHNADARDQAYHALQRAQEAIEPRLRLYDHLRTVNRSLSKKRPPELGSPAKAKEANAKWEFGLLGHVDAESSDQVNNVTFDTGLEGFACLLKATPHREFSHLLSTNAHGSFAFTGPITRSRKTLINEYAAGREKTIVGFTLSCNNLRDAPVEFIITRGGILSSSLLIDVKGPHACVWHCRIFFVDGELGQLANRVEGIHF